MKLSRCALAALALLSASSSATPIETTLGHVADGKECGTYQMRSMSHGQQKKICYDSNNYEDHNLYVRLEGEESIMKPENFYVIQCLTKANDENAATTCDEGDPCVSFKSYHYKDMYLINPPDSKFAVLSRQADLASPDQASFCQMEGSKADGEAAHAFRSVTDNTKYLKSTLDRVELTDDDSDPSAISWEMQIDGCEEKTGEEVNTDVKFKLIKKEALCAWDTNVGVEITDSPEQCNQYCIDNASNKAFFFAFSEKDEPNCICYPKGCKDAEILAEDHVDDGRYDDYSKFDLYECGGGTDGNKKVTATDITVAITSGTDINPETQKEKEKIVVPIEDKEGVEKVDALEPAPGPAPAPAPGPEPAPGQVVDPGTCMDIDVVGDHGCFNLTAYGWTGVPPDIPWEGLICVKMTSSEQLEVTFDSNSDRRMWDAKVWAGEDIADVPVWSDGSGKADTDAFPWGDGAAVEEQQTYTASMQLDSAAACSGNAQYNVHQYNLHIAAFVTFGDSCMPPTGEPQPKSTDSVWGQDKDKLMESDDQTFTYFTIPIKCGGCGLPAAPEPAPAPEGVVPAPEPAPEGIVPAPQVPAPAPEGVVPAPAPAPDAPEPQGPPGSYGDPHVKTWGGGAFDYHGGCDLVLVDNPSFHDGLGMSIHIRTKIVTWWSHIETAVVRVGSDTLEVTGGATGKYLINGVEGDSSAGHFEFSSLGLKVELKRATAKQLKVRIDLDHADAIGFETYKDFVRVNLRATDPKWKKFAGSLGLMGAYPNGETIGRDGKTVFTDMNAFGQEWQVRESEPKLFHTIKGPQHPTQCQMPVSVSTEEKRRRLGESAITMEQAKLACARVGGIDHDACVFDVLATNDKDMAGSY